MEMCPNVSNSPSDPDVDTGIYIHIYISWAANQGDEIVLGTSMLCRAAVSRSWSDFAPNVVCAQRSAQALLMARCKTMHKPSQADTYILAGVHSL